MAYSLSSLPANDLAMELAQFLDKSSGGDAVLKKVQAEKSFGAALNVIVSQSAGLWGNGTDKGMFDFIQVL